MAEQSVDRPQGINIDEIIVRRSELDDAHTINEIISVEESANLDLLYSYPKVLRLMETSLLPVTVLDKDENILGCLIFDSSVEIITGMNDFMHESLWEEWLYSVFHIENHLVIRPYNSLWLNYLFIASGVEQMDEEIQIQIVEKVFRFVYNTMPELEFILFHLRKEASSSPIALNYINPIIQTAFFPLEQKDLPASAKENLNLTSKIYISDRSHIIMTLEIRGALEQDHDDLVEICNAQSELYTKTYGDYFIAELIANQTKDRKAIVAQVKNKAKGLLSLSTDIDYGFLARNFELEIYDNLCSYEYMDAIRYKRREAEVEAAIKKSIEQRKFQKEMHDNKLLCSETGNQMILQQYCIQHQNHIKKAMEDAIGEVNKRIPSRRAMEEVIAGWLSEFKITQPGKFFFDNPIPDVDLYGHIISEKDLFLDTLTYFGLPKGYIEGQGQWKDHDKNEQEKLKAKRRKEDILKNTGTGKLTSVKRRRPEEEAAGRRPDYFDIQPLLDAFKNFVDSGPEIRTRIRLQLAEEHKRITQLFCYENGEPNDNQKQDILSIADNLNIDLQPNQVEGFGWVLECFGNCVFEPQIIKVPEKPKEENSELKALRSKPKTVKKEQEKLVDKIIKLANFTEFIAALDRLSEYDETLLRLNKIQSETLKKVVQEKDEETEKRIQKGEADQRSQVGSIDNPYINMLAGKSEEEIMRGIPSEAKNAVAVNIFFIEKMFESRSIDFLPFAFELFPHIEYIILTLPYKVEESVLLQSFIPVPRRENTNISHTLYIYHRACLDAPYLTIRKSFKEDVEQGSYLLDEASNEKEFKNDLMDAITNNASNKISFTAFNQFAVIGFFVMTKDVNLEYYKSHFCIQYHLLLDQYALTDHSRLLHSVVNPLFQRSRRFLFREILRLSNKKTLLFETTGRDVTLPDCFNEMTLISKRTFPKFLERKWDLERDEEYIERVRDPIPSQDRDRKPIDEETASFGLSLVSKRMLSVSKASNNTRILVVGASDTGISFIEYLLAMRYVSFPNITLLCPGGLHYVHLKGDDPFYQLKSQSINYSLDELRSLMLDARITVIDGNMTTFDRKTKSVTVIDHSGKKLVINYDVLVLSVGLVDNTIKEITRERPKDTKDAAREQRRIDGDISMIRNIYSIDNPYIYKIFRREEDESRRNLSDPVELMTHRKRPQTVNIYGRSINALTFASGLIKRGVKPARINIVMPPMSYKQKESFESNAERIEFEDNKLNDLDAFDGDVAVKNKALDILRGLGINVYEDYHLIDLILEDNDPTKIRALRVRKEPGERGDRGDRGEKIDEIPGSILVTASVLDIEERLFDTIQENGLVYNGRLIVKNHFETVDPDIFACGKIVEFSQQYKNYALGRSLRLDRYSGRELGQRLGQCVLEALEVVAPIAESDARYEVLPSFEMPTGVCAYLPGELMYIRVSSLQEGLPDRVIKTKPNRPPITSDNLVKGNGHFIKFAFDNNGLVKTVTYLGTEPAQVSSLAAIVGLSETYLNKLVERHEGGLVENVSEFLSENWAMALYHQWFSEFRFSLKQKLVEGDKEQIGRMLRDTTEEAIKGEGFLSRGLLSVRLSAAPESLRQVIRDDALQFIRDNSNHLPMYYVPGTEFQ